MQTLRRACGLPSGSISGERYRRGCVQIIGRVLRRIKGAPLCESSTYTLCTRRASQDLMNEPHGAGWGRGGERKDWRLGAQRLGDGVDLLPGSGPARRGRAHSFILTKGCRDAALTRWKCSE